MISKENLMRWSLDMSTTICTTIRKIMSVIQDMDLAGSEFQEGLTS